VDTLWLGTLSLAEGVLVGRVFPKEFRDQVVALYREGGRTYVALGHELGVSPTTVKNWVQAADRDSGARSDGLSASEHDELVLLRRKVKKQEREIEILGKAVAFFARNTDL
jgi:transposase